GAGSDQSTGRVVQVDVRIERVDELVGTVARRAGLQAEAVLGAGDVDRVDVGVGRLRSCGVREIRGVGLGGRAPEGHDHLAGRGLKRAQAAEVEGQVYGNVGEGSVGVDGGVDDGERVADVEAPGRSDGAGVGRSQADGQSPRKGRRRGVGADELAT